MGEEEMRAIAGQVKAQLRKSMRAIRDALPKQAVSARSAVICDRVMKLSACAQAGTVVGYAPVLREADPSAVLEDALAAGKTVGLPRIEQEGELSVRTWKRGEALEPGPWSTRQPASSAPRIEACRIELVLVPALAVDPWGYRIGYGKGFYDRLLAQLPDATTVALAYAFQLIAEVPREAHDRPVSIVVTDTETRIIAGTS